MADGRPVRLRAIRPDDADALVEFHRGLSPDTVYYRFFSFHPELAPHEVERFTNVDGRDRVALVAVLDERIVAVGRYDRLGGTTEAEVALVVADALQGCGLGTLLIEHLAAIGAANGLERFTAKVLPGNGRMLGVFRASGFQESSHLTADEVDVVLPLTPTAATLAAVERREHRSEARSVERLLHPGSVAVVGASDRPGSVGHALMANLTAGGFAGRVHPVNPSGRPVAGRAAHRSVLDIEGPVDLAVVAVPAAAVEQVVGECAEKGVGGLVIVTAGFAEAGADAASRQRELVDLARRHGMRVIGPNCIGIVNTAIGLDATFAPFRAAPGNVACLSQSGALGIALLERTAELGLGVSSFVSVGNKADVSGNDLLQYWEDDRRTDVVLLYLESFGNPRKFARIARRVSRTKPIVALKSGRSSAGRRAASSHTAAMASPDVAVDALFAQTGVIRVDTLNDLFDTAALLAWQPLPAGRRVAIVGNSGGPETMACDAAEALGLELASPSESTLDQLRQLLPEGMGAAAANPLDLLAGASPDAVEAAVRALAADDGVDAVVAVVTPVLEPTADRLAAAIARGAAGSPKPVLAAVLAVPVSPAALRDERIPWYSSPEAALHALARAVRYATWRRSDPGVVVVHDDIETSAARAVVAVAGGEPRWLSPGDAGRLLACYGITTVPTFPAETGTSAARIAGEIGFPVVVKTGDPAVVHKSDVGAVRLGLADAAAVRRAADDIAAAVGASEGYVVQPMVEAGVEMIAGITHDPAFGPLVMVGAGGVTAELLGDRNLHILPLTDVDAAAAVRSLRLSPLLFGYRGRPRVAADKLEDLLTRLAQLADDLPEIAELDLNPIIVTPTAAIVTDAKIRVAPPTDAIPSIPLRRLR
jgi:acetyl coenzyme A synthetase (ADP forming)-like protein